MIYHRIVEMTYNMSNMTDAISTARIA